MLKAVKVKMKKMIAKMKRTTPVKKKKAMMMVMRVMVIKMMEMTTVKTMKKMIRLKKKERIRRQYATVYAKHILMKH